MRLKTIGVFASAIAVSASLCACAPKPAMTELPKPSPAAITRAETVQMQRRDIELSPYGEYSVEYIHAPYGIETEGVDYRLKLNQNNTFTLDVTIKDDKTEHFGHWYFNRGSVMMFYDEEIEIKHNVYVADSIYADVLPKNRLMIFDGCYTVVLVKEL